MKHFPPMPPTPPAQMKMMKQVQNGQLINLNDPNIVSFKKKDMKGGLEKIEIIRKKSNKSEGMIFNYQLEMPEPLEMPELEGDIQRMKIIEKRMKFNGEKNDKIETEDNK
ncbi:MAG TPA: hypothetical protein VFC65_09845 [Prolixibacteraceae bacterium]|nr:hypothetical protein [Prolixibacteraceae bacterium]